MAGIEKREHAITNLSDKEYFTYKKNEDLRRGEGRKKREIDETSIEESEFKEKWHKETDAITLKSGQEVEAGSGLLDNGKPGTIVSCFEVPGKEKIERYVTVHFSKKKTMRFNGSLKPAMFVHVK